MSKKWKKIDAEKYREGISTFVQYKSKTINSNAALVGIRINTTSEENALDVPYISLRTLLGGGHDFPLDYSEVGLKSINMTVRAQAYNLLDGAPEAKEAGMEEIKAIRESMHEAQNTAYSTGTEYVDHRLRQILIPKEDAEGGYVSITPITASSICPLFFKAEQGLVWQHNEKVKKDSDVALRKIRQAQFGIGGSNIQNVGAPPLIHTMRRPIFMGAPQQASSIKEAFSLYHNGFTLSVHNKGALRESVLTYVLFRQKVLLSEHAAPGMQEREQEKKLIQAIAHTVLNMAAEAYEVLETYGELLPKEQLICQESKRYALVSPSAFKGGSRKVLRALLDPALRPLCENWPRLMARELMDIILAEGKEGKKLLVLDTTARHHLAGIMEEVFVL